MAQFRYIGDDNREVSMLPSGALRPVEPDGVFTVPDEHAESYEIQPHYFERLDEPTASLSAPTPPTDPDSTPGAPGRAGDGDDPKEED